MKAIKQLIYMLILMIPLIGISHAGILASTTRVIYHEKNHEKSLLLANTNAYPVLTQIWVDDGQSDPEFKHSPFVVLPAVFKLSPKESKSIRILYNGMKLPADRESLSWLNLYEIPAVKKDQLGQDYLNLAMNTQMKIFFRPNGLKVYTLDELQQQMKHQLVYENGTLKLQLNNPTPYYLNLINLNISNNQSSSEAQHSEDNILPPFSAKTYTLANTHFQKATENRLEYQILDDLGNPHGYTAVLN